jgi:hypothetical protein
LRIDVAKGERVIVLRDDLGGDLPLGDLAK